MRLRVAAEAGPGRRGKPEGTDNFPIGIIGGAGGMGRWFASFFQKEGYTVHVSGEGIGLRPAEMAAACPVVIVSVPIGVTQAVIGEVGPHMKQDSLLMDLTSLKAGPVRAMLEASASEVIGLPPAVRPGGAIPGRAKRCPVPGKRRAMAALGAKRAWCKGCESHRDNTGAARRGHGRCAGSQSF